VRSSQESRATPLSVAVLWLRRVSTSVSVSTETVRGSRAGNLTVAERHQFSADLSFSFRVPPDIAPLRSDVRTVLRYLTSDAASCIQRPSSAGCVPYAESRRSEATLLMDTDMPPNASAGLSVSHVVTEDVHANRKFSQFVLTATVRVSFQAGEVR